MFQKILIANRGEIAVRIMRTCREMGIRTVAVFSDVDRHAAHVLAADEAVRIGPPEPAESYLNMAAILRAAQETGAEAVHPGYGFLSENAEFAEQCEKEGLVFIGPPAAAIRTLGDKAAARRLMEARGVPIVPGMTTPESDADAIQRHAEAVGFPVMIKAAAGGGGKGMRIVETPDRLSAACAEATREARNAFGDGTIYLEKYIEKPRHVEMQILADRDGNAIHFQERECSIQRRHQKIIEETPSPAVGPELRQAMGAAAVEAARAAGYVNAGTVEFLLAPDGAFYFLEVNTRLQVEHPITEMVSGVDLVREQIAIAAGHPLSLTQDRVAGRGHAIECRIYAEDPETGFLPSPGTIRFLNEPDGPGIRMDSGVYAGAMVPVDYDPILSKLIAHAQDRDQAIRRMVNALEATVIFGVKTPVGFLRDVLQSEAFQSGDTFTGFIDAHFRDWHPAGHHATAAGIAFAIDEQLRPARQTAPTDATAPSPSPWQTLGNWRK